MQEQTNELNEGHNGDTSSYDPRETVLNSESQNTIINDEDNTTNDGELDKAADTFFPGSSDESSVDKIPSEKNDSPSIDDEEIVDEDDDTKNDDETVIDEEGVDEESPEINDDEEKGKVF